MNETIQNIYQYIFLKHGQYRTRSDGIIEVLGPYDSLWRTSVWFKKLMRLP